MTSAQGKTVIVTGAAGGLGKAIATTFLAAGANVVICDVNPERLASVEDEWTKSYADKFLTQKTDVTDEAAVQQLIDAAVSKFGRLDVLINNGTSKPGWLCPFLPVSGDAPFCPPIISEEGNKTDDFEPLEAGIMDDFAPVGACSKEAWDRVLNINLNGPFFTSKAAIAQFEKQDPVGGVIINIGSVASIHGFKSGAAYTVSKAALMALTKNTAGFYADKGIYSIGLMLGGMLNPCLFIPLFSRYPRCITALQATVLFPSSP